MKCDICNGSYTLSNYAHHIKTYKHRKGRLLHDLKALDKSKHIDEKLIELLGSKIKTNNKK